MQWSGVLPHESRNVGSALTLQSGFCSDGSMVDVLRCIGWSVASYRYEMIFVTKKTWVSCHISMLEITPVDGCGGKTSLQQSSAGACWWHKTDLTWDLSVWLEEDDEVSSLMREVIIYLCDSATRQFFGCLHHNFGSVLRVLRFNWLFFAAHVCSIGTCDPSRCHCIFLLLDANGQLSNVPVK